MSANKCLISPHLLVCLSGSLDPVAGSDHWCEAATDPWPVAWLWYPGGSYSSFEVGHT